MREFVLRHARLVCNLVIVVYGCNSSILLDWSGSKVVFSSKVCIGIVVAFYQIGLVVKYCLVVKYV